MGIVNKLEDDLIHPDKWKDLYREMPMKCKEVVDGVSDCIGIGKNRKHGWFIMMSGQGPSMYWSEKG